MPALAAGVSFYSNPFYHFECDLYHMFLLFVDIKSEKVYIMNALLPRFFLMFSCGLIPGAFLNSGAGHSPLFLFLFRYFSQKQRKTNSADIYYILF